MGVCEIKAHPWFAGVNWKNIRSSKAPNIPQLKNDTDTKYFENFPEEMPWVDKTSYNKGRSRKDVNFIGYTYKKETANERQALVMALEELEKVKISKPHRNDGIPKHKNVTKKSFYQIKEQQKKKIDKKMEQKKFKKSQKYFNEIMKRKGQKAIKKVFLYYFT